MTDQPGWIKLAQGRDGAVLQAGGAWTVEYAADLDRQVEALPKESAARVLELSEIEAIDTAGAWLLARATGQGESKEIPWQNLPAEFQPLAERVLTAGPKVIPDHPRPRTVLDWVADVGAGVEEALEESLNLIAFFGEFVLATGRVIARPRRFRWIPLLVHIEQTGINALPIVGLISFLVGVVLAYQGADQLRQFNAQFLTVNMVGISVLREMGILLTAIVVAGRSGSAFTAQIGTMQVSEEVDALRTMGLDPMEVLALPRVAALIITLPILTFFADLMGLLGGGVMCVLLIDMTFGQFVGRLNDVVTATQFWVGMVKAPVFAILIALVGCFEGLRVTGSAESVGKMTTRSVVEGIFLVIIFDALFSILFSILSI
ncbi:MAG TPA: MlaE family lipid ABC transporter permease subunit [Dongiaceae bacterium]|jgi:phospholipid/cholesterol/gamma-HCH transport system permease protein|nr:MlaE family lipid ABC transporter permease subunit [Dongiaceae bacterium]